MKIRYELRQETLDSLLELLAPTREAAGQAYESIRADLIRFFRARSCEDPESLTDETLNRIAKRSGELHLDNESSRRSLVFAFASRVLHEYLRRRKRNSEVDLDRIQAVSPDFASDDRSERLLECLDRCLDLLPTRDRKLMIEYYSLSGREGILHRREIARRLRCSPKALHMRVFRIRRRLSECLADNFEEKE